MIKHILSARFATVALLVGLMARTAGAQAPLDSPDSAVLGEDAPPELQERVRERIRIMRAWRLTEAIDMDEETALALFEHLDAYDARLESEQRSLHEMARELRALLEGPDGNDERLAELVASITATHLRIEELRAELVRESASFLTPRQQAGLMIFLPEFDREIRDMVRQVRRDRGPRSGPDPGARSPRRRRGPGGD